MKNNEDRVRHGIDDAGQSTVSFNLGGGEWTNPIPIGFFDGRAMMTSGRYIIRFAPVTVST